MRRSASMLIHVAVGCFAFYGTTGCNDRAASDPAGGTATRNAPASSSSAEGPRSPDRDIGAHHHPRLGRSGKLLEESWYAIAIDGKKVGHRSIIRRAIERNEAMILETAGREHIKLVREGREAVADFECIVRETKEGAFFEAEYRLPFGLNDGWTLATVDGRTLRVRPKSGNGPAAVAPWPPDTGGPFAIEKSLRTRPMAPGEARTPRFFDASLGQVITASLQAADWESTKLLGSECRLLRIGVRTLLPNGAELSSTLWIDDQGIIWKESQIVGVEVVACRTSKETALAPDDGQPFDLFRHVLVPVNAPITSPHDRDKITYAITVPEGDPSKLFVHDSRQQARILGPHQIQLVVDLDRVSAHASASGPRVQVFDPREPEEADLAHSSLIQCDDPDIQKLASSVAAGETNAMTIAIALEKLVFERVEDKSYGKVFASAAEVASSREGDCTEHSVLLVALCRARGIPARAAMGLVYSEAHQAFAYHMWTEAWTGDSWLGLDATLGRGRIGPTHLKMSQSSLEGPAALADMATILQAVGALEIEVVTQ